MSYGKGNFFNKTSLGKGLKLEHTWNRRIHTKGRNVVCIENQWEERRD
jgi:hypothetical protein